MLFHHRHPLRVPVPTSWNTRFVVCLWGEAGYPWAEPHPPQVRLALEPTCLQWVPSSLGRAQSSPLRWVWHSFSSAGSKDPPAPKPHTTKGSARTPIPVSVESGSSSVLRKRGMSEYTTPSSEGFAEKGPKTDVSDSVLQLLGCAGDLNNVSPE